jgi:hypothetical protein
MLGTRRNITTKLGVKKLRKILQLVSQTAYNRNFRLRQIIVCVYFHEYYRICVGQTRAGKGFDLMVVAWFSYPHILKYLVRCKFIRLILLTFIQ